MYKANKLSTLLTVAESSLKEIMYCEQAVVYVVEDDQTIFYKFDENDEKICFPADRGIVGQALQTGELMDIPHTYSHTSYHNSVDLDTELPVLCMPITSTKREGQVLAVIQVLNLNRIGYLMKSKSDMFEAEVVKIFCNMLGICIEKFTRVKDLMVEKTKNKFLINFYKSKDPGRGGLNLNKSMADGFEEKEIDAFKGKFKPSTPQGLLLDYNKNHLQPGKQSKKTKTQASNDGLDQSI